MGNGAIKNNISYSVIYKESQKPNESAIYRHPKCVDSLMQYPTPKIQTIQNLLEYSYKFGPNPLFGTLKNGAYSWRNYKESLDRAKAFGSGLCVLGLNPIKVEYQDLKMHFMALYSKNREEIALAEFACVFYGWTSLPLYDTLGAEALDFILEQTEVELMVCSLENLTKLTKDKRFGSLKTIVVFEPFTDPAQQKILNENNIKFFNFDEVVAIGEKKIKPIEENLTSSSIFSFSYTSGTTGKPKGAMLTHGNLISVVVNSIHSLNLTENDVYISYLPLSHVLEKIILISMVYHGCSIGFYGGDVQKLKDDLAALKPTVFVTVPRLLLRFHDVMQSGLDKLKGCKKSLATKAVTKKTENINKKGSLKHGLYDKLIFKKMKQALGGRVRLIMVGSAPTSVEVLNFLKIAFSCNIMEGYGQTESTGASFVTYMNDNMSAGCVGGPCVNTEFKVVDVPEMNYKSTDTDDKGRLVPRGEICIRGYGVFRGYYKDEEKTKEAIDEDGWLHTGDIVQVNPNGSIKIIDRKKNIFKLSQGEYVAAEKIESVYLKNKCVAEIFVYGDSLKSYLIAIVVPNMNVILEFANKSNLPLDNVEELLQKNEIRKLVLNEMTKTAKEAKLMSFEMVKTIYLEQNSFALKDLLTTTFKLKRHEAKKNYEKIIEELYKESIGN